MNMNFKKLFIMKKKNKSIQSKLRACCVLLAISPLSLFATQLNDVTYSAMTGDQVRLKLKLDQSVPQPASFLTNNPARIVIDIPNTSSTMSKRAKPIGSGSVRSVTAIGVGSKTRVIIDLLKSVNYTTNVKGNNIIVVIGGGSDTQDAMVSESTAMTEMNSTPSYNTSTEKSLSGLDFRRGAGGEGRVVVTLSDPSTVVDLDRKGGKIVARFENTILPNQLRQVADVTDFATPVTSMKSYTKGNDTVVEIAAKGKYDYFSYQTNNEYTIEFRELTKEEQEKLKRKESIEYRGDKLSLNFQEIEVRAVLQLLADFTGINMVVSDSVDGNITLRLNDVPWDHALDIILKTNGLSKRQKDNVMLIGPTKEISDQEVAEFEAEKKIEDLAPLSVEFINIKYASAKDIKKIFENDRELDAKSTSNKNKGKKATSIIAPSSTLLSSRGQATVDERTNTLIVRDTALNLERIRQVVEKLDVPVRQVLIEARVVIANQSFSRDLGIRLGFNRSNNIRGAELAVTGAQGSSGLDQFNTGPFLADTDGNPFNSNPKGAPYLVNLPAAISRGAGVNFILGKVGSYLLNLELQALQIEGNGEIVSSPRLVTSDSKKATITQGFEIPYEAISATSAGTLFKKAELKLEATPHITPDDRISMELKITKDEPDFSLNIGVPAIATRNIETTVLVKNGETIVLGGVFESANSINVNKVPFFGDIPFVGRLFKNDSKRNRQVELLIFVTPKIIKD